MIKTAIAATGAALLLAGCSTEAETDAATDEAMMDPAMDEGAMADAGMAMPVTVTIEGVQPGGGQLFVALQSEDNFLAADGAYTTKVVADGETVTATFDGVTPGTYAAAVIHDENGDDSVELGSKGPTEAWGLSGDAQSGKPAWMPAMFEVTDAGGSATVMLSYD